MFYDKVLGGYSKYVGSENVLVRIFDRNSFPNGNVIYDFADLLKLQLSDHLVDVEQNVNRSFSRALSEATGKFVLETGQRVSAISDSILTRANPLAFRSQDTYRLEHRRAIITETRESLEAVRQTYRPDLQSLFSYEDITEDAVDPYPDAREELDLQRAALDEIIQTAGQLMKVAAEADRGTALSG